MGKIRAVKRYRAFSHWGIAAEEYITTIRSTCTPEELVKYWMATEGIRKADIQLVGRKIQVQINA